MNQNSYLQYDQGLMPQFLIPPIQSKLNSFARPLDIQRQETTQDLMYNQLSLQQFNPDEVLQQFSRSNSYNKDYLQGSIVSPLKMHRMASDANIDELIHYRNLDHNNLLINSTQQQYLPDLECSQRLDFTHFGDKQASFANYGSRPVQSSDLYQGNFQQTFDYPPFQQQQFILPNYFQNFPPAPNQCNIDSSSSNLQICPPAIDAKLSEVSPKNEIIKKDESKKRPSAQSHKIRKQQKAVIKNVAKVAWKSSETLLAQQSEGIQSQTHSNESQLLQVQVMSSQLAKEESQLGSTGAKCSCKKSQCLKLYCECFANGRICGEECGCVGCCNTQEGQNNGAVAQAKEQIIAKNPQAFTSKVNFGQVSHRTGCKCKRSGCQKAYCECFQLGVPCGVLCKCTLCKNGQPCASHSSPKANAEKMFSFSSTQLTKFQSTPLGSTETTIQPLFDLEKIKPSSIFNSADSSDVNIRLPTC